MARKLNWEKAPVAYEKDYCPTTGAIVSPDKMRVTVIATAEQLRKEILKRRREAAARVRARKRTKRKAKAEERQKLKLGILDTPHLQRLARWKTAKKAKKSN